MKQYFKKTLCIFSVMALMLTGCGAATEDTTGESDVTSDDDAQEGGLEKTTGSVALRVWGSEEDGELLNQIISSFKSEYGDQADFEITIEACPESDCKDKILDVVNNAPDVFTFADDQLSTLASAGVLTPIEVNVDEVSSRNSASSVAAASINDTLYAYPLTADNGYFLYYNKAYFDDASLQTLDGILQVAASNGKKVTMDWSSGWYLYSFFGNTGLTVGLNDDGISNYCTWNATDGDIKGTDVANAMMSIASSAGFMNGGDDALSAGALNDSVIAGISGVWLSTAMEEAWGDNLGAIKLPTYTVAGSQVQMSSYAGYKMVGANNYSENKYWAETLADYITNETNQTLRFNMRGQGPSNTNAAASSDVAASPAIQALISQSEYSSLQRIGANYWAPAAQLGADMYAHTTGGLEMQEYLDNMAAEITASNSN